MRNDIPGFPLDVHFVSRWLIPKKIGWLGSSLSEPPERKPLGARLGSTPATHVVEATDELPKRTSSALSKLGFRISRFGDSHGSLINNRGYRPNG
jgi:hypothetical protein